MQTFNTKCGEFMGIKLTGDIDDDTLLFTPEDTLYDPHDDLNQLALVLEKAAKQENKNFLYMVDGDSFEQQARDFVGDILD